MATVSGVVEDLKFKISEGSDPNWWNSSKNFGGFLGNGVSRKIAFEIFWPFVQT